MASKPIIAVIYYSTYGHTAQLAEKVIKGIESTGAVVKPYCFQETLPKEVLSKMHAGGSLEPKHPVITPDALKEADGIIIGAPTRYGRVPAQVSAFFDQCGGLWAAGALNGKFVSQFTSVAGQHGGHETTFLTTMPFFVHMGLVYVPIGYANQDINTFDSIQGGTPYGASTVAKGDGSRMPSEIELGVAEFQGSYFAKFVGTFVRGKHLETSGATSTSNVASASEVPSTAGAVPATPTGMALGAPVSTTSATAAPEQEKTEGYQVPKETSTEAAEPNAASTDATNATPAEEPASQPNPETPAAAPATESQTPAAERPQERPQEKKEKKGGLFASCCGGRGIED